jgi:hypothetical protein
MAKMTFESDTVKPERIAKDLRYRRQLFPAGEDLVFKVSEKGFVPVPIVLRKLLRYLTAPEVRVLLYFHLRASRYGICYPGYDEIVHELGLTGKKNLLPHIKSLEDKKFISVRPNAGRTFFLVHDPRIAIKHLVASGVIRETDLVEINELYADLGQAAVVTADQGAEHPEAEAEEQSHE